MKKLLTGRVCPRLVWFLYYYSTHTDIQRDNTYTQTYRERQHLHTVIQRDNTYTQTYRETYTLTHRQITEHSDSQLNESHIVSFSCFIILMLHVSHFFLFSFIILLLHTDMFTDICVVCAFVTFLNKDYLDETLQYITCLLYTSPSPRD